LSNAKPDATPEVMAGLSTAVMSGQVKSISPSVAQMLLESSLQVWPNHPDLLMVRAQDRLMVKDYSKALIDLEKALLNRPRDVKLHEMLSLTYKHLGQLDKAKEHSDKANNVRLNAVPQGL
jgi:tetratricopeptide (TPR) repeat protein